MAVGASAGAIARDIAENADVIAVEMSEFGDKVRRKVREILVGIAIHLGGGLSEEQQRTNDNKPKEEQVIDDKAKKAPGSGKGSDPDPEL
jgi:hypothetical protein